MPLKFRAMVLPKNNNLNFIYLCSIQGENDLRRGQDKKSEAEMIHA